MRHFSPKRARKTTGISKQTEPDKSYHRVCSIRSVIEHELTFIYQTGEVTAAGAALLLPGRGRQANNFRVHPGKIGWRLVMFPCVLVGSF